MIIKIILKTFKNITIFNDTIGNSKKISEIKELKIFISQKNFFDKEKFEINKRKFDLPVRIGILASLSSHLSVQNSSVKT